MADLSFEDTLAQYLDDSIVVALTPAVEARVSQIVIEEAHEPSTAPIERVSQIVVEEAHEPNAAPAERVSQLAVEYAQEPNVEKPVRVSLLVVEVAYKRIPGGWRVYEVRRV